MTDRPGLSKGELEVARMLWQLKNATVREVHDALSAEREIDFSTVQTYLRRLESKGYARAKLDGRTRIYAPKVKRLTVVRETVDDLVGRLFGGNAMPLMRYLIEDGKVSADELDQLKALIEEFEQGGDDV